MYLKNYNLTKMKFTYAITVLVATAAVANAAVAQPGHAKAMMDDNVVNVDTIPVDKLADMPAKMAPTGMGSVSDADVEDLEAALPVTTAMPAAPMKKDMKPASHAQDAKKVDAKKVDVKEFKQAKENTQMKEAQPAKEEAKKTNGFTSVMDKVKHFFKYDADKN